VVVVLSCASAACFPKHAIGAHASPLCSFSLHAHSALLCLMCIVLFYASAAPLSGRVLCCFSYRLFLFLLLFSNRLVLFLDWPTGGCCHVRPFVSPCCTVRSFPDAFAFSPAFLKNLFLNALIPLSHANSPGTPHHLLQARSFSLPLHFAYDPSACFFLLLPC
jgi:hypothetical protein